MLDINPRQYAKVMDQIPHKFPQDAPIFGKPNVLINPAQIEQGQYIYKALETMSPSEMIELAETYQNTDAKSTMLKIFEKIEKEEVNEYTRAEILSRAKKVRKGMFNLNSSHDLRLLQNMDS